MTARHRYLVPAVAATVWCVAWYAIAPTTLGLIVMLAACCITAALAHHQPRDEWDALAERDRTARAAAKARRFHPSQRDELP